LIYFIRYKSGVKMVFQIFYNLVETEFSVKIKTLQTDNGSEYINKVMTTFLETQSIINDLLSPYAHQSHRLPKHMNYTIVTLVRSMTLDYANAISQAPRAEACSIVIHIMYGLRHRMVKLGKSPCEIMFSDKPSIKHLYPFVAKWHLHVPEKK
jgi:hypothetical protein